MNSEEITCFRFFKSRNFGINSVSGLNTYLNAGKSICAFHSKKIMWSRYRKFSVPIFRVSNFFLDCIYTYVLLMRNTMLYFPHISLFVSLLWHILIQLVAVGMQYIKFNNQRRTQTTHFSFTTSSVILCLAMVKNCRCLN